jgi:hypothetical protein
MNFGLFRPLRGLFPKLDCLISRARHLISRARLTVDSGALLWTREPCYGPGSPVCDLGGPPRGLRAGPPRRASRPSSNRRVNPPQRAGQNVLGEITCWRMVRCDAMVLTAAAFSILGIGARLARWRRLSAFPIWESVAKVSEFTACVLLPPPRLPVALAIYLCRGVSITP